MSNAKPSLAEVIREVVKEDRDRLGSPPSLDELASYATGELTDAQAERIRDELVARAECRDLVLGLKSFPQYEPPSEEHRISDGELSNAWSRMKAELALAGAPTRGRMPATPHGEAADPVWIAWLKSILTPSMRLAALGASFVLGIVCASLWDREAPRLNVEIFDLVPESSITRSAEMDPPNTFSENTDTLLWILSLTDLTEYSAYVVEIVNAHQEVVWSADAVRRTFAGPLNVEVPSGYLSAGRYRVQLFGVRSGERRLLEEYAVRIKP